MRKQITTLILSSLLSMAVYSCSEDKVINQKELPQEILSYVESHFPHEQIAQATMDNELGSKKYEVALKDNIIIEFDKNNKATEIESTLKLPDSVVPAPILDYVETNYPENVIIGLDIDKNEQQVKLDNMMELEFDSNGKFVKLDN